ncbi:MAG: DUF4097 domain-containing protein [Lachnospiraceae bacterium]|nr:DUF4097 domain-containing protein [Lachnospiraceae bacterium]
MKRFMKGCAITALILGIIGVVFVMVGGAVAKRAVIIRTVEEATRGRVRLDGMWGMHPYENGLMNWLLPWMDYDEAVVDSGWETPETPEEPDEFCGSNTWYEGDEEDTIQFSHSSKVYEGDVAKFCPGENIRNLDIEIGGSLFQTEISEDDSLYLEASDVYKFQSYLEDDTLCIRSSSRYAADLGEGRITLYIPKDYQFHEVDVELGAGELDFSFLYADSACLEVGAGQLLVYDRAEISKLDVSIGAGCAWFEAVKADELDVEVDMGIFSANEAEIGRKVSAECAMGSVELTLKGCEEDFDYKLECDMGSIELDGKDYGGFGREMSLENGASREIEMVCSMGHIGIGFTD